MKIKTILNENYKELELHICKDVRDEEVHLLEKTLHELLDQKITAVNEKGERVKLFPGEILSFYSQDQKVYALRKGDNAAFVVSQKLYELEKEFEEAGFTRISKSELINFRMIRRMDMSMTGTIKLIMKNGYETYTSRRNVSKIKNLLMRGNEQ